MSSSSREIILKAIRRSQDKQPTTTGGDITERLKARPRGPLTSIADDLEAALIDRLQSAACTVAHASSPAQIGQEIAQWLQQQCAALKLVCSASPLLDSVVWPDSIDVRDPADGMDHHTTVTEAYCAIAETGSLVKLSSHESPTALNFLPDNFICVVRRERIVRHIEDVWDRVRKKEEGMPRALNIITGPSRTADVEQTIQLGAHGPRRMHVIIYS
jgi:L-lactate dehydrogenase complex protein LldG